MGKRQTLSFAKVHNDLTNLLFPRSIGRLWDFNNFDSHETFSRNPGSIACNSWTFSVLLIEFYLPNHHGNSGLRSTLPTPRCDLHLTQFITFRAKVELHNVSDVLKNRNGENVKKTQLKNFGQLWKGMTKGWQCWNIGFSHGHCFTTEKVRLLTSITDIRTYCLFLRPALLDLFTLKGKPAYSHKSTYRPILRFISVNAVTHTYTFVCIIWIYV